MTGWVVRQFRGPAPRVEPRLLADDQALNATNLLFESGVLVPMGANSSVATLTKAGTIQSIHRFGLDVASDSQYWFHWAADIDVARGPVYDDTQERTYYTDGTLPKVTDNSIALSGGADYPMAGYTLGVPAPTSAPVAVVSGTPESDTALQEDRVYIVTFVTSWGEEGMPSDVSNTVSVQVGEDVDLDLPAVPTGAYSFAYKRIYRSVAGTGSTEFLYVGKTANAATTTFKDSVLADDLGEVCPSLTYAMPPADMIGIVAGANGVMAGFTGKYAYFCEPYKPHAWPYFFAVDTDIVSIKPIGSSWLILTKGRPFVIMGSHPSSYAEARQDLQQACVSKRSVAEIDGGVVFAAPDGLFVVGNGSSRNVTEAIFTRKEWQALNPSTLSGWVVDNFYVGFFSDPGTGGIVIDLRSGNFAYLDWYATAGYYDPQRDQLFLVVSDNDLVTFNTGAAQDLLWRSKRFYSPRAINLGMGRVEAEAYDNGSTQSLAMKVYADGVLKHTQTVTDGEAFRLPSGFTANTWEFQIEGNVRVTSAGFAETVQELQGG